MSAALGFRAHSGWACLVAVAGSPASPEILERGRVEMADEGFEGSAQPFHLAEGEPLARARAIVERCAATARRRATDGLGATLRRLAAVGRPAAGAVLLAASGRKGATLEAILASHALIHTHDGELFRDALASACEALGVSLARVPERELVARATSRLKLSADQIQRRLAELGRPLGPPWRQDEKLAALAAWLALASR